MAFTIDGTTGINLSTEPLNGLLPGARLPSGSTLTVTNSSASAAGTINASTAYGNNVTITTVSSTSRILCFVRAGHQRPANSGNSFLGVRITHSGGTIVDTDFDATHDDTNYNNRMNFYIVSHGQPVGTVLTITPRLRTTASQSESFDGLSVLAIEVA